MRILFMGTPAFAIPSLHVLLAGPHTVAGVVTRPDRPQGRGLRTAPSPVKRVALEHGLPVLQPDDLHDPAFLQALRAFHADVFVVVAFRILPAPVPAVPPKGTVNLHASLLPKYRGAAPIQRAIIQGEQKTGVTTFFIERRVDAGRILLQRSIPIGPEETAGELHDRLADAGAELLRDTIELIAAGRAVSSPQRGAPSRAPKLVKEDGRIDWSRDAPAIHNQIRGMNPYPVAFTTWRGRTLRVWRSRLRPDVEAAEARAGEVVLASEDTLAIRTGAGCLALVTVQPEGRRRMPAGDFVRGYPLRPGDRLGSAGKGT